MNTAELIYQKAQGLPEFQAEEVLKFIGSLELKQQPANELAQKMNKNVWQRWFDSMTQFSDDFMATGREQPQAQEREWSVFE
jgi:hypothetical protein